MAKHFPATIKPVVQWCLNHEINMIQMPCPESLCPAGGLIRQPHGKTWYERQGLRDTASRIAKEQAAYAHELTTAGCTILAIIGMEFSPACAVNYLNRGPIIYRDEGIFIEELRKELSELRLIIPFIGINQRCLRKLERDLNGLLETPLVATART